MVYIQNDDWCCFSCPSPFCSYIRIGIDDFRIYCYYKMYLYIKDSYHTFVHTLNMLRYIQGDYVRKNIVYHITIITIDLVYIYIMFLRFE